MPTDKDFDSLVNSSPKDKDIKKIGLDNIRTFWSSNKELSTYPPLGISLFPSKNHMGLGRHIIFRDDLKCIRPVLDV